MIEKPRRPRAVRLFAAASLAALWPGLALAQATAPAQQQPPQQQPAQGGAPAPAKPGATVSGVTVEATQAPVRTSIDRRSYGVATDLRAAGGSVADALRNIPGAEIDVNGNLSFRGGPVQVMIDGQPSQLFSGPQGSQALQGMPADRIERVEVITNPTAAFSPEGGAGIINLVTKKSAPAGESGGMRANYGSSGHANVAANFAYVNGKLTLTADGGWRQDPQKVEVDTTGVVTDPVTGQNDTRAQHEVSGIPLESWNGHVGFSYQLDPKTTLSGEGRYNAIGLNRYDDYTFLTAAPGGAPISAYDRTGSNEQAQNLAIGQLTFRRQFDGQDHNLTAFYNHTALHYRGETPTDDLTLAPPPPVSVFQDQFARINATVDQFKADYTRPMPGKAQLKTGYDLRSTNAVFDNFGVIGPDAATAAPNPVFANLFRYGQMVNAAYVTYEQPFGDFTVLGGLRLEDEQLHLDQITQAMKVDRDEVHLFPTLHLGWRQSPTTQWTLNYSERIQRPNPQDLDPWRNLTDPFNVRMGNPDLESQVTHSFEGAWNWRKGTKSYIATLFYRQMDNGVTDVVTDLGAGVLQTNRENQSSGRTAGLELVAAAPLTKTIDYNVSTDLYWNQITAPVYGLAQLQQTRQGFNVSGRGNINWNPTKNDLIQFSAQVNAGRITPQGHVDPLYVMYFGYKHKFTNAFSMVVQAQDPFDLVRQYTYLDSPGLTQRTEVKAHIQSFMLGFTWTFGGRGRPQRDPGFDFNAPTPGALPGG